ncbi:hypothetical protein VFPPC_10877 [Pochonia chlamydosporia 170]|uniref:DUF862-domain-containing protein n=1 Tax=Pochonia chlamydosporia 170 TaxID=1380566 RepID=A0A179EYT8_METCM|nr:hypothetical protein VFPPC_10877 [Pochonia chlamydosporia 170]OAQ58365.1 hypothetical protein VFPPC_10877 [Pochonia chlamydosporia 170]
MTSEPVPVSEGQEAQEKDETMRDKVGEFLKKNYNKGELALKHSMGLGSQPNAVPVTDPVLDGPARPVEVGWHPVGGPAGKWFAQQTRLGKMITDNINKYPDPTQHWAVLVGDFAHQLWMDENFDVIYTNERIKREEWRTFQVGETRFNDEATRIAGESVIAMIREKQPGYNLITNNCQTYALQLLDAIKVGAKKEFGTTLAVYERIIGPGKIKDLFADGRLVTGPPVEGEPAQESTVSVAQQVMNENTTQLDAEEQMKKSESEGEGGEGTDRGIENGQTEKKARKRDFFTRMLKK